MKNLIPYRKSQTPNDVLRRLQVALAQEFRTGLGNLRSLEAAQMEEGLRMLSAFARLRTEITATEDSSAQQLAANIERWTVALWNARNAGVMTDDLFVGRILMHLATARQALRSTQTVRRPELCVVVPVDLLFELQLHLFPAERMAVIAGREIQGQLVLGACFDVTSHEASRVAYTRADPMRLAQALRAMDASGTRLLAWAHSHPGESQLATHPSDIDRRQWAAWVEDFDPLLGLIVTIDGHVRFWGEAFEADKLPVRIMGDGHRRVDHHVYRIAC
jgi:proteasome lid subunit RPN8/RPN11